VVVENQKVENQKVENQKVENQKVENQKVENQKVIILTLSGKKFIKSFQITNLTKKIQKKFSSNLKKNSRKLREKKHFILL